VLGELGVQSVDERPEGAREEQRQLETGSWHPSIVAGWTG
jgi:hypothetical protein